MKKYNLLILISILSYLLLACLAGFTIYSMEIRKDKEYKIEINRIYNSLSGEEAPGRLALHSENFVKRVTILSSGEEKKEKITSFYEEDPLLLMEIKPVYRGEELAGYVRFDYEKAGVDLHKIWILVQVLLAVMELFVLALLLYVQYSLIRPFHRLSELPLELAKGHLKSEVKEEKSHYFGQFIWGISQLKDTLDVTKKRELELEKEKKQMLLSLSHDIKTPLNTIGLYGRALEEGLYPEEEKRIHAARQIGEKTKEIEKYLEEIIQSAKEDILDIQVEKSEFYLDDLMKKMRNTYREKCSVRMVELEIGPYENRLLKGDMNRVLEVFDNLMENAFKYGDGRRIQITFDIEEYCQLIRIHNSGEWVTDHEFNHIFESFFRGGNSQGKNGLGLGLYICREIMRKMDGEIYAEKEEGGMTFVLVFR